MKQMSLIEMDGFLKGKCIPSDLKVNETNAEYLVRKFAEAEAKISALSEDHQKAIESIKQADAAVKLAHEKFSALAAENAGLKQSEKEFNNFCRQEYYGWEDNFTETPATDAFLAEVRAEARNEGINYTASRLAAAFNHGFINKSLREVFDVTRMILSAKEELANEPHPIDGLSGEYAEKSLEEWAEQIRKGGNQAAESNRGNEWTGNPDIDNAIIMLDRIDTAESCDDDRIEAVKAVLRRLAGNYPDIPDGLSTVCAEAYQVVGVMADALGVFGDAAVQKVLDNLSQQKLVHRDVLPFSLPVTPDGWISCSERMPDDRQEVNQ